MSNMYDVNYGRVLMGDSLGFHIIFALLSIGFPFVMSVLEYYAWKRKSEPVYKIVRLLTDWTTVLAVVGVISGTIIAMQFAILWGPFIAEARPHVGKFFMLEGYAFMVEAEFLAWYRISAGKVSPGKHWLIGLPITLGAMGSAVFITIVNAWMNNPSAIITSTTFFTITHSVAAYLLASVMVVIGWVAWRIWRTRTKLQFPHWLIFRLSMLSLGLIIIISLLGHASAQNLAKTQPLKLAGIEVLDETGPNAPLRVGGGINESGKAEGGVVIPSGLSVLAGNSPDYEVQGLDQAPKDRWPLLIIHTLFDAKMILVGIVSTVTVGGIFLYLWKGTHRLPRWYVKLAAITSLSGILLVELGWMITELGRQPWAIHGKMLTKDAFTTNNSALSIGYIFPVMFVVLFGATLFALSMVTKRWRAKEQITW